MIYFEGLESIIESTYLHDTIGNRVSEASTYVNPGSTKYLTGKVVIINSPTYPEESISELVTNGCEVVVRGKVGVEGVIIQPYILRLELRVMWNGRTITNLDIPLSDILRDYSSYDPDTGFLYFPKLPLNFPGLKWPDGELSCLGWVAQQVGVNIKEDTIFRDLDILKTGKVSFSR